MALLDALRKKAKAATPSTDVGALERAIVTGQTGREQEVTGPAASGIGEQLAAGQVAAQQKSLEAQQLTQTEQLQTQLEQQQEEQAAAGRGIEAVRKEGLADISAQAQMEAERRMAKEAEVAAQLEAQSSMFSERVTNTFANALANLASEGGIAEQDMFSYYLREQKGLDAERAEAQLDQIASMMALSDRQYVDTITRVAEEQNLRDELAFRAETNEIVLGKNLELLKDRINFDRMLNQDAREFAEEMANISLDEALKIADQAAKEAAWINTSKGVSKGISSGIEAYAAKEP